MFAQAARRLGYGVAVWDPDPDAPAHRWADHACVAPFFDEGTLKAWTDLVGRVTYEWENVPVALCERLERAVPVRPGSRVLRLLQNRIEQKEFLSKHGLPVPSFQVLSSPDDLIHANRVGFPCLVKTATSGYDGKGQRVVRAPEQVGAVQRDLGLEARADRRWILEAFVPFVREISVLVVRSWTGACRVYPVAENLHEGGILRTTRVPAGVAAAVADRAQEIGQAAVEALEGVGVFCVELFVLADSRLLINEIAPRPHNSGHYTMNACSVSQFEQQVRTLCDLPLGDTRLLSPAAMVNLLGREIEHVTVGAGRDKWLGTAGACLHVYGKRSVRPGRKMGHITFVDDDANRAAALADELCTELAQIAPPSMRETPRTVADLGREPS
jgi:5-(carboxyamino)imidazole ribonucleotide synthase